MNSVEHEAVSAVVEVVWGYAGGYVTIRRVDVVDEGRGLGQQTSGFSQEFGTRVVGEGLVGY